MSGVISRGVRAPIIREGDDIVKLTADAVEAAMKSEGFELHERDIVAVTESVVARSDGNYASVDDIAADVRAKLGGETVAVVFPILSRNRFAICLRGIARGSKKSCSCSPTPPTRSATTSSTRIPWTTAASTPMPTS